MTAADRSPVSPREDEALTALSRWIDESNVHRAPEAVTWGRIAKIAEEFGEATAAYIGATGQNPRKGVTHTMDDVVDELLDVAITALGAVEHCTGNSGDAMDLLSNRLAAVAARARLFGSADGAS